MVYRLRDSSAALSFSDHSTTGAPSTIVIVTVNTEFVSLGSRASALPQMQHYLV